MGGHWNPLIPLARKSLDAVAAENHGVVTTEAVRERLWAERDAVLKAVDLFVSTTKLVNSAVTYVVRTYGPAYKVEGGYERVDGDADLTVTEYDRIIALYEEQLGADTAALAGWRNRRAERAIRDAQTVPQEMPTFAPVE